MAVHILLLRQLRWIGMSFVCLQSSSPTLTLLGSLTQWAADAGWSKITLRRILTKSNIICARTYTKWSARQSVFVDSWTLYRTVVCESRTAVKSMISAHVEPLRFAWHRWLHRAKLSGAVYCYRSCLFVCGCVCLWVCFHDNSKLRASIFTKLGL